MAASRMTLAQAKALLHPLGIVLAKKDGEYRVSFRQRPGIPRARYEDTAYYTNDITDAVATGRHMAAHVALAGSRRERFGNAAVYYVHYIERAAPQRVRTIEATSARAAQAHLARLRQAAVRRAWLTTAGAPVAHAGYSRSSRPDHSCFPPGLMDPLPWVKARPSCRKCGARHRQPHRETCPLVTRARGCR